MGHQNLIEDSNCNKMHSKVIIFVLGLIALVAADSREFYTYAAPQPTSSSEESVESAESVKSVESVEVKYSFNYAIDDDSSSTEFGHEEVRDGDDTQGSYVVELPDGRLQRVSYYVDGDDGFVAEVTYEGEAQYSSAESIESSESSESSESVESAEIPTTYYVPDSNESK